MVTLFVVSFLAGALTVLAPCVLPLLPVVIGSSVGARSKMTPYIVIGSLAFSILIFTYLLKATTAFISIPPYVWSYISGGILLGFGLILVFPKIWESLKFISKSNTEANKLLGTGYQKKSIWGDVIVGAALGPVFSTCSPTYFVILATVLPASFFLGTLYLLTYLAGLVFVLVLIALLGQKITNRLQIAADGKSLFKKIIGGLFVVVGIFIITGLDKKLETFVLDSGYLDISQFESRLLEKVKLDEMEQTNNVLPNIEFGIPDKLVEMFPKTNWSKVDINLANVIQGNPNIDGIPPIDNPKFVSLSEANIPDSVQTIVLSNETETKVYPYNILNYHEIVNDTFGDTPVAVTFCPLCGSAIVYDRTLPNKKIVSFGVSGWLLESNLIMYDRETQNLWQQSTGKTLAGSAFPAQLEILPMQLMSIAEVRRNFPEAKVLSEDTGYSRDYSRSPYAGYESNLDFIFAPSSLNTILSPKTIVAVFQTKNGTYTAVPWLALRKVDSINGIIEDETYTLKVEKGELSITDSTGHVYPFYFEMWFSFSVQHQGKSHLIEIN